MTLFLAFMVLFVFIQAFSNGISLEKGIEFDAKSMRLPPQFNPKYWYEKRERNTSIHYDLWKRADVELLEWPGNVTKLDPNFPLLKWTKSRAKYVHNICSQDFLSMDIIAYAHKYVHLTWGSYRLTQSYCPPLTVPASIIRASDPNSLDRKSAVLPVVDFGFVLDTLLVVTSKGAIIRISGLEMAFAIPSQEPAEPLKYSMAQGLTAPVDKIVTQSCCSLATWCPNGDTVLTYKENTRESTLYISYNGGQTFSLLKVSLPSSSSTIHSAVLYPEQAKIAILHGETKLGTVDKYSMTSGKLLNSSASEENAVLILKGKVQMSRVGNEQSMLIWDDCNVWYSFDGETTFEKSLFYMNKIIDNSKVPTSLHKIKTDHCHFGLKSALSISPSSGKIGFLDGKNIFFLGMDSKKPVLQLVAMQTDVTLILPSKTLSIVPYFDVNNGPKLLYPPRYLRVNDFHSVFDAKKYSKRLAMRLLMKTLFPSEFITVFYQEQIKDRDIRDTYALQQCMTSTLSLNKSVTQMPKVILMSPTEKIHFYLTFKSKSSALDQLSIEPKAVLKSLDIDVILDQTVKMGLEDEDAYWFKYMVSIRFRSVLGFRKVFLVNFHTDKGLRCNQQPQQTVWVVKHFDDKPKVPIPMKDVLPPILTNSNQPRTCGGVKAPKTSDPFDNPSVKEQFQAAIDAVNKYEE